jgi:hypothetical protein
MRTCDYKSLNVGTDAVIDRAVIGRHNEVLRITQILPHVVDDIGFTEVRSANLQLRAKERQ